MRIETGFLVTLSLCTSGIIFSQTNPDILKEFRDLTQKVSNLQKGQTTNEQLGKLYFLDRDILKSCPERDPETECVKYMKSNADRFGEGDGGFYLKDFWLKHQSISNSTARGDYEIDRIINEADIVQEGFGATVAQLEPVKSKVENWLGKYKKHPRHGDGLLVLKSISKELEWKKKKHEPNEIYQP